LTAIVVEALDGAEVRLDARGMKSDVRAPASPLLVRGDDKRLRQLVANLLENSLRYTHAGGRIRATVMPIDGKARLTWEDSPPGVPDAALPRLFERLYRVDGSRSREAGGSGLGLAICESIAAAHGGTIRARHSELGGLAVELELPREGVKKE
jgi:two-component system sensor histidine kinase BaeS